MNKQTNKIKMIVTDLDGTLLMTDKTISDYTASIFKQCRERGIKIVFATARPLSMVTEYIKQISIDGLIATNGAFIYAGGNLIRENLLPVDIVHALQADLAGHPDVFKISARSKDIHYTTKFSYDGDIVCDFKTPLEEMVAHLSFQTYNDLFAKDLIQKYPELEIYHVTGENLYDVGAVNCSKMNGVKILAEQFGIDINDIAAFGDDFNDIGMLQTCGTGVAMMNAIDEVKVTADVVCDSNQNDGVAKWLEENVTLI